MGIKSGRTQVRTVEILSAILGTCYFTSIALAQSRLEPILPLQFGSAKEVPLLEQSVRDPDIADNAVHSAEEATSRRDQITSIESRLDSGESIKRSDAYLQLIELYGSLAYYYADGNEGKQDLSESLNARLSLVKYAGLRANLLNKTTGEFARNEYLIQTNRILTGSGAESAVSKLRSLASKSKLDSNLKLKATFLISTWDVNHGNKNEVQKLLKLARNLPRVAAVAAQLTVARSQAGLNGSGNKANSAAPSYKKTLLTATKRSDKIGQNQTHQVLSFAIAVWRLAEGSNSPWSNPPINLSSYAEFSERNAIIERQAIDSWAKNKSNVTISSYKALSAKFSGEKQMSAIDRRILDLEEIVYQETGNYKNYEAALSSTNVKYTSEQAGSGQAEPMIADSRKRLNKMVHTELNLSARTATSKAKRSDAINLAERYVVQLDNAQEKESIKVAIAGLLIQNNKHKEAVAVYLDLANEAIPAKKSQYLALAAQTQRIVANWPESSPWKAIPKGSANERATLLAIDKDLNATRQRLDWPLLSHIGQLYLHTGAKESAYSLWMPALKTSAAGVDASHAAGTMIADYHGSKNWQNLENIARLARTANLVPIFNDKAIDTIAALALALLEGGKAALASNDFPLAVKKLTEFVQGFRAVNRDEGMYSLASAYHGNQNHVKSIETLMTFSEEYVTSRYLRQALLNGGDWTVPMADEENAMYFYELFLKKFANDSESPRILVSLADLYLGRRLYAEAAAIMTKQINDKTASSEEQESARLRLFHIEEKFGSTERAAVAASSVLKYTTRPSARSEALAAQARSQAAKGQVIALVKIEAELAALGGDNSVQESLAETRFLLATARLKPMMQPIDNLTIKDPTATISGRFADFTSSKSAFQSVCDAGETSFCVPALHRIARLAERLITVIEEVTITPTYPEEVVKAFDKKKTLIINSLSKESLSSDQKSLKLAEKGYTNPEWIDQVYWQNSSDMNFERVSGETGRAYVQWPIANQN